MLVYVMRRLLVLPFILLGVSLVLFFLTHLVPGDPAKVMAGEHASPKTVEIIRKEFGLDKPLHEQYGLYVTNLFRGNLGTSIVTRRPVAQDLKLYFPATLELTVCAMFLTVLVGLPLGILSATKKDQGVDHLVRFTALSGVSMPVFWLGLLLQLVLYRYLGLLPIGGRLDVRTAAPPQVTGLYTVDSLLAHDIQTFLEAFHHLALPAFVLAFGSVAVISRVTRSSMLETLAQDHIRTARAKGLPEKKVLIKHAFRNAAIPLITVLGMQIGLLLGGAVVTETVFAWPGMGRLAVDSIRMGDYPVVQAIVVIFAFIVIISNLAADILAALIDPRIRLE